MTPSPAPTSSGLVAGFGSPAICPTIASRRVTNRSVSHLMAGFLAVYFFVWLPMTTPGVSGAGALVLMPVQATGGAVAYGVPRAARRPRIRLQGPALHLNRFDAERHGSGSNRLRGRRVRVAGHAAHLGCTA